jgi:excisionase family DNA binding protein
VKWQAHAFHWLVEGRPCGSYLHMVLAHGSGSVGPTSGANDEYLVLEEVAAFCRASLSTVRFWIRTGKLRSFRPGRRRLVRRADVVAFVTAAGRGPEPHRAGGARE